MSTVSTITDPTYSPHMAFANFMQDEQLKPFVFALSKFMENGHVCLPINELPEDDEFWADYESGRPKNANFPDSSVLLGKDDKETKPFVFHKGKLYLHRYFFYESQILERIRALHQKSLDLYPDSINLLKTRKADILDFLSEGDSATAHSDANNAQTDWGRVALIMALLQHITIITGGPGTGKTTLIKRIVKLLRQLDPNITFAFAAFTGKAAGRMREALADLPTAVDQAPNTIHKLLGSKGMDSKLFKHHKDNPLPYKVIIVDECSMIGTPLFAKLLDAVQEDAKVILLGDADQLASIEAGTIFGDLCKTLSQNSDFCNESLRALINEFLPPNAPLPDSSKPGILIRLLKNFRYRPDSPLGIFTRNLISGEPGALPQLLEKQHEEFELDDAYSEEKLKAFCENYIAYILEPDIKSALDKLNDVRILCAVNASEQGVDALNEKVETILKRKVKKEANIILRTGDEFYEHQPIMVTRNDAALNLSNGDVGIVRRTEPEGPLMACFPCIDPKEKGAVFVDDEFKGYKAINIGFLSHRSTVYAMTIHKSQGSEFKNILIVLPKSVEQRLLTAELLYTALTRWKGDGKVILQSTRDVLEMTAGARIHRISGIPDRLHQTL